MQFSRIDEDNRRNWSRALILLICATLFWFALEVTFATLRQYSIVQIVWTRYCVHLFCMLILLGPQRALRHARTEKARLQIGRGTLMIIMPILGVAAITRVRVAEFMTVFWLLPLLVMVIAQFFTGRRIHLRYWAVSIMAYLGVLVIFRPGPELFNREVLFALGSGSSFSLYIVLTHRLQETQSLITNLLYTALVVICPLTLVVPYFWQTPSLIDGTKMFMMGVLGLATLWCLEKALELSQPVDLAPVLFLFPLWRVFVRVLSSGSMPSPSTIIGSLMVIASLVAHHLLEINAPGENGVRWDFTGGR